MITNPKGWRDKRAAALARKSMSDSRREVNALRWRIYNGEATEEDLTPEQKFDAEIQEITAQVDATTEALETAVDPENPDNMENKDLRQALEDLGYEVPKNTARARLIELYKEKVT